MAAKRGNRSLLESARRKTVDVEVDDVGTFTLREMSGTERDRFEDGTFSEKDGKRTVNTLYLRARLVALCLVDENGSRMYQDAEVELLSDAVPSSVLNKIFDAAQKLNGLDPAAIEAAAKNSAGTPPADSGSV